MNVHFVPGETSKQPPPALIKRISLSSSAWSLLNASVSLQKSY
jgi:hypothetical protein